MFMIVFQFFFLVDLFIQDRPNRVAMNQLESYKDSLKESKYDVISFGNATNPTIKNLFYLGIHAFERLSISPYIDVDILMETEFSTYEHLYFYRDAVTGEVVEPLGPNEVLITENTAKHYQLKVGDFIEINQNPSGNYVDQFVIRHITQPFFDLINPNPNTDNGLIVFPFQNNIYELFPNDFSNEKFQHIVFSPFGLAGFFYTQVQPYRTRIVKETLTDTSGLDLTAYTEISQVDQINRLSDDFIHSKFLFHTPMYVMGILVIWLLEFKDFQHIRNVFRYHSLELLTFKLSRMFYSFALIFLTTIISLGVDVLVNNKMYGFLFSIMVRHFIIFLIALLVSGALFTLPKMIENIQAMKRRLKL